MDNKYESQKKPMMGTVYTVVPQPLSLADNVEVQKTRKILIIILGVLLGLTVMSLVSSIFLVASKDPAVYYYQGSQIGQGFIGILFYGFGIFAAYRYSTLALRVFAWLSVIQLVLAGIALAALVLLYILVITGITAFAGSSSGAGVVIGSSVFVGLFLLIIIGAVFALSLLIVKLAFKLARLIDANQRSTVQQA